MSNVEQSETFSNMENKGERIVQKTLDLNKKLTEEMLNSIQIDDNLAKLLIQQDDEVEENNILNFSM